MYNIIINRKAQKKLKSLSRSTKAKITGDIKLLGLDPEDARLDVKKLKGKIGYRMKIGQWRVLFDKDETLRVIAIEKIGARGDVYK